jgi:hypothetical protein
MAEDQQAKAGWLERRRDKKREKAQRKAQRAADQRGEQAAAAERPTRGWQPEPPSGP